MKAEPPRADSQIPDPDDLSPPLDQSRLQRERRAATDRLLARRKALDRTQRAETPRAYARRYVREQESLILGLLGAGAGTDEILADLALAFPSISSADFRHAIVQLRDRHRKRTRPTTTQVGERVASTPPAGSSSRNAAARPAHPPASAPDRRADESEEDYRLRKALEVAPAQSRHFIGEQ